MLDELYQQIAERNERETLPFIPVYESNATLMNQIDGLTQKCQSLERQCESLQQKLDESFEGGGGGGGQGGGGGAGGQGGAGGGGVAAALRNEVRLREKLEKVQEEMNGQLRRHAEETAKALKTANDLAEYKERTAEKESEIKELAKEKETLEKTIGHLHEQVEEAKSNRRLAEQQYNGLKDTIRSLQEENDELKKENRKIADRMVKEKEATANEINVLNEMVEKLRREVDMLRTLQMQEASRSAGGGGGWFGGGKSNKSASPDKEGSKRTLSSDGSSSRLFGTYGAIVPTSPKTIVQAHRTEATCVRYDGTDSDLVVTSGSESVVKVWETGNGTLRATLRGNESHVLSVCDISGGLVVAGGSDKTCRVWKLANERMIHQLAGHGGKITCARFFGNERSVLTGSGDRTMKVWDISRTTYRQTVTLRHSSWCQCLDVSSSDAVTVVSGHNDGGVRLWDLRSGNRSVDMERTHATGVTSVQFHPSENAQVITNGKDGIIRVIDVRTSNAVCTIRHEECRTDFSSPACSVSPDGRYIAAGSSSNGTVFVWKTSDGSLETKLDGAHPVGVTSLAWGRQTGQQVASVDRKGNLVLWA